MRKPILFVLLAVLGASPQLHAQSRAQAPANASDAEYSALIDRAAHEYERGNWPEAKVFFVRAHAMRPSARTLRGLGLTSYEMRSYVEACDFLRLALDSRERPLTDKLRTQAETALSEASAFIARYRVSLEPKAATLKVDDRPPVLREGTLWLDPGTHLISAELQGWKTLTRSVLVQGGEQGELRLSLEPSDAIAAQPRNAAAPGEELAGTSRATADRSARDTPSAFWNTQRTIALGLGIGGVIGAGIGSTYGLLAAHEHSESEKGCNAQAQCDAPGYAHGRKALERARVSTISFIASGALLAAGAVVFFTAGGDERPTPAVSLLPELGPANAGVTLAGRW